MSEDLGGVRPPPQGVPEWLFLELPKPSVPGEIVPPIPVTFSVGLTDPDVHGHRWAILRGTDGTATVDWRIPWQMGPGVGMAIAQGLAAMAQKADEDETGGLVIPGRAPGGGSGLVIPGGVPIRRNGGRGNG